MTKITIDPIRRREIKNIVLSALRRLQDASMPVRIKSLCKTYSNIRLVSFSLHMKRYNLTYDEMRAYCDTSDSCAVYNACTDQYIIYYNDYDTVRMVTSNRYRWNIAHELGHILLSHHSNEKTRIFRSSLSKYEYDIFEAEADYFAQLILVPHMLIYAFKLKSQLDIMRLCKISGPAAYRRHKDYVLWLKNRDKHDNYDREIAFVFHNFIFKKECTVCGAALIQPHRRCPICGGEHTLRWGDGKMIYSKLDTYANNKVKTCPRCGNEETNIEGEYCQICGSPLINRCDNRSEDMYYNGPSPCGMILPSNARYCPNCGNPSTFFNDKFLISWQAEQKLSTIPFEISVGFINNQESEDDNLPFQ